MNCVTTDTNHVMINEFDVMIDRKYVTKDDTYVTVSMLRLTLKGVTEIIWHLTFAPCHDEHVTMEM